MSPDQTDPVQKICPLCGEEVCHDPAYTFTYLGYVYAFCGQACRDRFAHTPDQFIVQLAHEYGWSLGYACPLDAV